MDSYILFFIVLLTFSFIFLHYSRKYHNINSYLRQEIKKLNEQLKHSEAEKNHLRQELDAVVLEKNRLDRCYSQIETLYNYQKISEEREAENREHAFRKQAGLDYERYIGYLFEQKGYSVIYLGAIRGMDDNGIDLICSNDDKIYVVQCKNWNPEHMHLTLKPFLYLLGASILCYYRYLVPDILSFAGDLTLRGYQPIFCISCKVPRSISEIAKKLGMIIHTEPFDKRKIPIQSKLAAEDESFPIRLFPRDRGYDYVIANTRENPRFYHQLVLQHFPEIRYKLINYVSNDIEPS